VKYSDGRRGIGGHQRVGAGNPNYSGRSYPAPTAEHHETCFELVERVKQAHRKGRAVRLELPPEQAGLLLMAALDIGALAAELHDRALPDGPPLLHQLRQYGRGAA
jgi:hypothetical protein